MKIILVVFLLTTGREHSPLYYTEFNSLKDCEIEAAKFPRGGWYPLKAAYCVEFKK